MNDEHIFPFGNKLELVRQADRSKKKVFVLGVYASAVHAHWKSPHGKTIVRALAVASEPDIFWNGDGAEEIIRKIKLHPEIGRLEAADPKLNGPSGRALDEYFLGPLGLNRDDSWLCDLVPHTCINKNQMHAIEVKYNPIRDKYDLPRVSIPGVPSILADNKRCTEILDEIRLAKPKIVILLGDQPIKWFLKSLVMDIPSKLSEFLRDKEYGEVFTFSIEGESIKFLLLVHPRQAAGLSIHSSKWKALHRHWMINRADDINKEYLSN